MKNTIKFLLFSFLLVSIGACASPKKKKSEKQQVNQDKPKQKEQPKVSKDRFCNPGKDWKCDTSKMAFMGKGKTYIKTNKKGLPEATISIMETKKDNPTLSLPLETLSEAGTCGIKLISSKFKVESKPRVFKIGKADAVITIVSYKDKIAGDESKAAILYIRSAGIQYNLLFQTPLAYFDKNMPIFEKFYKSFK